MDFPEFDLKRNPVKEANPFSRHFYIWLIPFFWKGYRKDLELEDLYLNRDRDGSAKLGDTLEKTWNHQLELSKLGKVKHPRLHKALWSIFGGYYSALFVLYAVVECALRVSQPIFVQYLVQSFAEGSEYSRTDQYLFAMGVILSTFLVTMTFHPSFHGGFVLAMRCRVACSSLIYRKSLRLSKSSEKTASAGSLVNLLSNDVNRFDYNLLFLPYLLMSPIQLGIFTYFLWRDFGVSALPGIGIVLVVTVLQYFNGKLSTQYRRKIAMKTDERGRTMHEIVTAIRVIKMYAWEKPFTELIRRLRKLEMNVIRKRSFLRGLYLSTFSSASKLVPFITFLTFVLTDNQITADKVFFTVAAYNTIIQSMMYFVPTAVSGLGEMWIALRRIEDFLLLEEKQASKDQVKEITGNEDKGNVHLTLEKVSASWTGKADHLRDISFNANEGLVCVVGPIGSGKTTLLHLLLDEIKVTGGHYKKQGRIAYACQEPWIFAGNVRQNILFGEEFDLARYTEVVQASALIDDLQQFEHGDMTIVGDRGVSLSGGQKARINLARCLYQDADIVLLDDPLSAVDAKVSRHIFEECVKEYLKKKITVLVTHQLQYLPQADHIIVLDKGGILAQGTFSDLTHRGVDFVNLLTTEEKTEETPEATAEKKLVKDKSSASLYLNDGKKQVGHVEQNLSNDASNAYWKYWKTGGSYVGLFLLAVVCIGAQLSITATEYWMALWTNAEQKLLAGKMSEDDFLGQNIYLYVYGGLVAMVLGFNLLRALGWFSYSYLISVNMHNKMFQACVRAPTKFYDDNPPGRISNRFMKDLGQVDELLPPTFFETMMVFMNMAGVIGIVIATNWVIGPPALLVLVVLYFMRNIYVSTSQDVKRIEGTTKSPVFSHAVSSLHGLTTIRSSQAEPILIQQFDGLQDYHTSAWYIFIASNRCFGIFVEMISVLFLAIVSFSFLVFQDSSQSGSVGMAITSAMNLSGWFQFAMRQSAEVSNYMTSVERTLEYAELPAEANLESKPDKEPPKTWPASGHIVLKDVSLTYSEKQVLRNLSFEIKASEKMSIVGRTGAGKSSIIQALFRMTEPTGQIFIDGVEINGLGLHDVRKKISIIPQDPVLFQGSMRYNLDPFEEFPDDKLWVVLEEVGLKENVPSLDYKVSDGGSNFSVGQKQLICLARAILRSNKILVMDEATANVDPLTDNFIQETIRNKFKDCTIITIAHRLHTVMESDRVLVLDKGVIKEYDHPWVLLQDEDGVFSSMVASTGKSSAEVLKSIAQNSYLQRA